MLGRYLEKLPIVLFLLLSVGDIYAYTTSVQDSTSIIGRFVKETGMTIFIENEYTKYIPLDVGVNILPLTDYDATIHKLVLTIDDLQIKGRKAIVKASQYSKKELHIELFMKKKKGGWMVSKRKRRNHLILINQVT